MLLECCQSSFLPLVDSLLGLLHFSLLKLVNMGMAGHIGAYLHLLQVFFGGFHDSLGSSHWTVLRRGRQSLTILLRLQILMANLAIDGSGLEIARIRNMFLGVSLRVVLVKLSAKNGVIKTPKLASHLALSHRGWIYIDGISAGNTRRILVLFVLLDSGCIPVIHNFCSLVQGDGRG